MQSSLCPTSVAILLAAYNGEKFIREQINSIVNQDCDEWTLYIRDDGSGDSTVEVIRQYAAKDPRIILLDGIQTQGGLSENFFALLRAIDADYYMFADQDDIWLTDKVRVALDAIRRAEMLNPGKMVLIGSHNMICDETMNPIQPDFWYCHSGLEKMLNYNMAGVSCCLGGADMIFNKELRCALTKTAANRLFYDHWVLMCALGNDGYVSFVPQILRMYRQHSANALGANIQNSLQKKIIRLFADYKLLDEVNYGSFWKYALNRLRAIYILKTAKKKR